MSFIKGFTLIEFLASVAIFTLIFAYGAPTLNAFVAKNRAYQDARKLKQLLQQARHEAVYRRTRVQLCPLNNQGRCTQNWNQSLTMFVDVNKNKQLDANERILKQVDAITRNGISRQYPRQSIYFNAEGLAWGNNGTLEYCNRNRPAQYGKIVVAPTGRVRTPKMTSGSVAQTRCDNIR